MPRTYFRGPGQRRPQEVPGRIKYYVPQFYDPYFFIQGSEPEKMVMKELVRRGIYFEHTPQTNDINWGFLKQVATSDPSKWEADFLFPQFKIWLEVQGAYFHTLPGVPEKEALRFAIIEAAGWRPIYWWDYDIIARLPELMDSVPEFYRPPGSKQDAKAWAARNRGKIPPKGMKTGGKHSPWHNLHDRWGQSDYWNSHHNRPRTFGRSTPGLPFLEGGTGIDHLAGLRTANRNRATTPQYKALYRTKRRAKIAKRYVHG
jgi:hypothetical protein